MKANDHKGHWHDMTFDLIGFKMRAKQQKLTDAICSNKLADIKKHATDLAVYCAMIHDKASKKIAERTARK
jgi:hypothetical protein